MSEDIKELKNVASRLNEASDALNESLNHINAKLKEMNIGLNVWLEKPPLSNRLVENKKRKLESTQKLEILGYAKTSNGWGLAVKTITEEFGYFEGDSSCPYTNSVEGEVKLLMESSRDLRVAAIKLLPELIALIKERSEMALENIELAKTLAAEL